MSKNEAIEMLQDKVGLYESRIKNSGERISDLTSEIVRELEELDERQQKLVEIYAALKILRKVGKNGG